jgi:hypothetical protein
LNLHAAAIKGVAFHDTYQHGNISLPLRERGLLKYLVIIDAYVPAYYLEATVPSEKALTDLLKRLEIHYFHKIKAKDFAAATNKFISANKIPKSSESFSQRSKNSIVFIRYMEPGDRYALTYAPGLGAELSLNVETRGLIQ